MQPAIWISYSSLKQHQNFWLFLLRYCLASSGGIQSMWSSSINTAVIIHHPRIRSTVPTLGGLRLSCDPAPGDSGPGVPILGETCELWMERRVMVIDIVAIISILGLSLHSDHRTDRLPTDIRWDRAGASHPSQPRVSVEQNTRIFGCIYPGPESQSRECLGGGIAPHDDNILLSRNENYSLLPMDIKAWRGQAGGWC